MRKRKEPYKKFTVALSECGRVLPPMRAGTGGLAGSGMGMPCCGPALLLLCFEQNSVHPPATVRASASQSPSLCLLPARLAVWLAHALPKLALPL